MARKTKQQIEKMKKDLNISRLWSFSRVNGFLTCSQSYFLKYIRHEKELTKGVYSVLGNAFHDILEDFYSNKIEYKDMILEANKAIIEAESKDMKFNITDEAANQKTKDKYFSCIQHFFENHIPVKEKVLSEKEITIRIKNNCFFGYIDAIHKEGDNYIVTDYKSSTIYTGEKILKEGKQLTLYAMGIHQQGIPLENIKIRWNFLKYAMVTHMQKNGKEKNTKAERHLLVAKMKTSLRMFLKDLNKYTEDEIEGLLDQGVMLNSMSIFPQEIQDKYVIRDCYVEIPLSKESITNLENSLNQTIHRICTMEKEYETIKHKEKDTPRAEKLWYKEIEAKNSFFCYNICSFTAKQCSCYKDFLERENLFKNNDNKKVTDEDDFSYDKKVSDEDSQDWMKVLGLS